MKSFLRYVETGRARMDFQQLDEASGDVKYQKALSIVDSVVPCQKTWYGASNNPKLSLGHVTHASYGYSC